jgi:hypothetical protein
MLQLEVPELPELPQYTIIVLLAFPAPCSSGISVPPPRSLLTVFFFELRLRCFEQRKNLRSQVIRSRGYSFALG